MELLKKIIELFEHSHPQQPMDHSCPVCWGFQEYDGKKRVLYKDKQVDVNNHCATHMRTQKFIKTHFDGFTLKKGLLENPIKPQEHSNNEQLH